MTKVFISYSHDSDEHKQRVRELWEKLCGLGLEVVLDQIVKPDEDTWPKWCQQQIETADFVLMVMTETYARRLVGNEEPKKGLGASWEGHFIYHALYEERGKNKKFVPVLFTPEDWEHAPSWIRHYNHYNPNIDLDWNELLHKLGVKNIKNGVTTPERISMNIPRRNRFFTGRKQELASLAEALEQCKSMAIGQAIAGLGGVGKTQLAVAYLYENKQKYRSTFWINADKRSSLVSGLASMAQALGLADLGAMKEEDAAKLASNWMRTGKDWLVVFDNMDSDEAVAAVQEWLPEEISGHVLVTTRRKKLPASVFQTPLKMGSLPQKLAEDFLIKRVGKRGLSAAEKQAIRSLAKDLGGLPLALEQAAAYIHHFECSFSDYLGRYRKKGLSFLEEKQVEAADYPLTVAKTWEMNFEYIKAKHKPSLAAMKLAAFLHPDDVPFDILLEGSGRIHPDVVKIIASDGNHGILKLLEPLHSLSLIDLDGELKTFSMHRMVQEAIKLGIKEKEKKQWAERAVFAVNEAFPHPEFENWATCERILPHTMLCFEHIREWGLESEEAGLICNQAGVFLYERGRYTEAEPLYIRALEIREKALGPDTPRTAVSLNNLALLYKSQGKYEQAEPLYKRAMEIREKALGPDHPDTATSLNNLAGFYESQGKYGQAEPLYTRALEITEKALGPGHPNSATSLNNLATLYKSQGKYDQAEPLYKRAMEIREKALGPDHPDTAQSLNNLAALYDSQGEYDQAEPLYKRAMEITKKALGSDHPDTALNLNNLAVLYYNQKKYNQADPLMTRALQIAEKALGPEHPTTRTIRNNLAILREKLPSKP